MKVLKIPRKSVSKVFHPLGKFPKANGEILCLSQGLYYVIKVSKSDVCKVQFGSHDRLILRVDFRLVRTSYGVVRDVISYDDIYIPSQVQVNEKSVTCRCLPLCEKAG